MLATPAECRAVRVGQRRVEPAAAPGPRHLADRRRPAQLPEDLGRLGDAEDPPQQRDLLTGDPGGVAAPVPVLVERRDRLGGRLVHPDLAGHVRAALAAQRRQLTRALRPVRGQCLDAARLGQGRAARRGVAQHVAQRLHRPQVIGDLAVALDRRIGVAVERGHLGRVRRAARVLEQQRVEERGSLPLVQADLLAQAHSDQAGALRVAAGLALCDVEGVRERGQDFGQAKLHAHPSTRMARLFSARCASGTARRSSGSGSSAGPPTAGRGGSSPGRPPPPCAGSAPCGPGAALRGPRHPWSTTC